MQRDTVHTTHGTYHIHTQRDTGQGMSPCNLDKAAFDYDRVQTKVQTIRSMADNPPIPMGVKLFFPRFILG
eukprot:1143007-Pelagomonas_calceolata.AAC.6